MWNPFFMHVGIFTFECVQACYTKNSKFNTKKQLKNLLIHVPLFLPIKNLYSAVQLYQFEYGSNEPTNPENKRKAKEIEELQHEATQAKSC
jgi:hypothetical protein